MSDQPVVARAELNAHRPYATIHEREATGGGASVAVSTLFLTASECPVGCSMCDLWKNTLTTATPVGAIPNQIDWALQRQPKGDWIKLYNSGNFFDVRSIPPADYVAIANRCAPFSRVIVENHPAVGRQRIETFRDLLDGRLEIAVGLETVQPRWLTRLGKRMTRDRFDRFARDMRQADIDLRVFLIVGVPGVGVSEAIRWARLSVRHAIQRGARHVSLIPARAGHGWNGRASELPTLSLSDWQTLQADSIADARGRAVVTIDLWDDSQWGGGEDDSDAQSVLAEVARVNLAQQGGASAVDEVNPNLQPRPAT